MARRTWRWSPEKGELIEVTPREDAGCHFVQGDMPAFISPLDGSRIEGRAAYEAHCRKHNVVPTAELQGNTREYDRYAAERDRRAMRELLWEQTDKSMRGQRLR